MAEVFEAADLRKGLKEGGELLGAFIVVRASEEFVVYVRVNWIRGRGFRLIRTWRNTAGDRTFKHLDSAWRFVRSFEYFGRITVYPAGDLELHQFAGVASEDFEEIKLTNNTEQQQSFQANDTLSSPAVTSPTTP